MATQVVFSAQLMSAASPLRVAVQLLPVPRYVIRQHASVAEHHHALIGHTSPATNRRPSGGDCYRLGRLSPVERAPLAGPHGDGDALLELPGHRGLCDQRAQTAPGM